MGSTNGNGSPEFDLQRFASKQQPAPKPGDPDKPPRQRLILGPFTGYTDVDVARLWNGGANAAAWYLLAVLNQVTHRKSQLYRDHRRRDPDGKTVWVHLTPALLTTFHITPKETSKALRLLERLRMVMVRRAGKSSPVAALTWQRLRVRSAVVLPP